MMRHRDDRVQHDAAMHRGLPRRDVLRRAVVLGVTAPTAGGLLAACGGATSSSAPTATTTTASTSRPATGSSVAGSPTTAAEAPKRGGTMTFAVTTDPETLDPHVTSNPAASTVFGYIYSTLIYQDLDLKYRGLLAENWETSPDNLTISFKLKSGITFQDGSPFTADAVKFTFERLQKVGTKSPIFQDMKKVTKIEAPDDATVKLTFSEPSATFFHAIATSYGGILSRTAIEKAGDNAGRTPVGTGPYQLKDWQTGAQVMLAAFQNFHAAPDYYQNKGTPYIDALNFKVIPEASSQTAALEAGEVDTVGLTARDFDRLAKDSRFQILTNQVPGLTYLGLTCTKPPFTDVRVRQAVAHAINRDEIITAVFEGKLAQPVYTPLPPSIQGYNKQLEALAPKMDLNAAKMLLTEAGFTSGANGILMKDGNPFRPVLYTTTDMTSGQVATLIQAQLRKVGIDMQIKQLEQGALLAFTPKGEHDMLLLGYSWSEPDALYLFLSSDRLASSNRVHFENTDFDNLVKEGQRTLDFDKRMQIYYDAQKIEIEQQPWVPLYTPLNKTAVATRIHNARIFPIGGLLLDDAFVK